MVGSTILYFLSAVFLISVLACVCLVGLTIAMIVDVIRKKEITNKKFKIATLVISAVILALAIPHWFLYLTVTQTEAEKAEKYAKLAINTSFDSFSKCIGYDMLEGIYYDNYKGQAAIETGEKYIASCKCNADVSKWKVNPPQPGDPDCAAHRYAMYNSLCTLYTIKGDYVNGVKNCGVANITHTLVAINYILINDYNRALDAINIEFENNKKISGSMYATRAYIYEHLGEHAKAASDYAAAEKSAHNIVDRMKGDKNYFQNYYDKLRALYDFSE